MKQIKQYTFSVGLALLSLGVTTSCIEETEPFSSTATEKQVEGATTAVESMLWALPQYFNASSSSNHYMFGYGAMMHMRDVMTGDQPIVSSGYDWFSPWQQTTGLSQDGGRAGYTWSYYYGFVHVANRTLSAIPVVSEDDALFPTYSGYRAVARAFRALAYLELAQMYEFKENDKTSKINEDGNDVLGLTVPIVREDITEEQARNNPRVPKDKMAAFILEDLAYAKENIGQSKLTDNVFPGRAAVDGLLARYYLWVEDYPRAKQAARDAIDHSGLTPMKESDALDVNKGFNDRSLWIWAVNQTEEDRTVQTGIINWISWMSNETSFGYAGAGPFVMIDRSLYDRIGSNDWRKKLWKAPEEEVLAGQTPWIDSEVAERYPTYASAKFRPNMGNRDNYTIGAAAAYPVMRVEEMYLIEAEAEAHMNPAEGMSLLSNFISVYRNPVYTAPLAQTEEEAVEEVILQKRIELWGEGLVFFDIKRLNLSVTRGYRNTNFYPSARLNTEGRPAWMNFCIVRTEAEDNPALDGWNNPNPTRVYPVWTGE